MIGEVIFVNKRFSFITSNDNTKYFVRSKNMLTACDKDTVDFSILKGDEVIVNRIITRNTDEFVGVIENSKNFSFVVLDKVLKDVYIKKKNNLNSKNYDLVKIKIYDWGNKNKSPEAKVIKNYGNTLKAENVVSSKIDALNIPHKFSKEVLAEVDNLTITKEKRVDLTSLYHVTIDGSDTKDMDDAVYLEKKDYGYYLVVSIADVSSYVKKDSLIDKEAYTRSNSVYLYDRVIPMLPQRLTNDLCSLNPNEDNLTLSVIIKYDDNGNVISSDIVRSKIRSRHKLTYEGVNEILNNDIRDFEYSDMLFNMQELSEKLTILSKKRGTLEFEIQELKLKIGEDNRLCKIELRKRDKAEILIENFMIAANEQVANYMFYNEIPCVYRIHEKPSLESMQALNEQLKDLNYEVKNPKNLIKKLQKIIELTKDTKLGYFIHKMILNSMKKAIYSKDNKGHFGLSLKNYLHFTSPIRRYSDLMVHRILLESMDKYMSEFKKERINKKLNTICKTISNNERRAQKMEYLARDIKLTEYMMKNLGKKYKAMVTSINNGRCFVNLENYIEAELLDDIKAHLGENLEVMVVGTDMLKGKIYVKRLVNGNSKK